MAMRLRIDPSSGIPLGVQIARQIRGAVAAGRLSPGDRLPTARDLAADLGVNFHTVRRAFADLADEGVLDVGQGRGTFVAASAARRTADLRAIVRSHVARLVEDLAGGDVDPARIVSMVAEELARALPQSGPMARNRADPRASRTSHDEASQSATPRDDATSAQSATPRTDRASRESNAGEAPRAARRETGP